MRERVEDIREAGADLVVVGSGSQAFAAAFVEDFQLRTPVLIDPELQAYRAAGLRRGSSAILSPRLATNAARALQGGSRQTGVQGDAWQLGGVRVIAPGGGLLFQQTSREAGDHASVDSILAALSRGEVIDETPPTRSPLERFAGRALSRIVDPLVAPSFDKNGFWIHSLDFDPSDLAVNLAGKRIAITGANSGIGFESARALADLGATVVLLCRDRGRGEQALETIRSQTGNTQLQLLVADMSDLSSVRQAATHLSDAPLSGLIHNAGTLPSERIQTRDQLELTFATHVAGPWLLTQLLRGALTQASEARVIWVSSGGMYTRRLNVSDPQWTDRETYDGVVAYAETKRAQVVLSELWADQFRGTNVQVNAMHPGWADTPSVAASLPRFHKLTERFLRSPAEGADTIVWLAASRALESASGLFFFDRKARSTHWLPGTRESHRERTELWNLCRRVADVDAFSATPRR